MQNQPSDGNPKFKRLKDQIVSWANRAEMAQKMGNEQLAKKALDYKRECENQLALLQEFEDERKAIKINEDLTVQQLADKLEVALPTLIKYLFEEKLLLRTDKNQAINANLAREVAIEMGFMLSYED